MQMLALVKPLTPGLIILPANMGLTPELVQNSELFTLIGGAFDAILLPLALADKIRILPNEKDEAIQEMQHMLTLTRTDHLTGIANRHAFDQNFTQLVDRQTRDPSFDHLILCLLDLDGMKHINDTFGHLQGDQLLCSFTRSLEKLESRNCKAYRIGGDEFTIVCPVAEQNALIAALQNMETELFNSGFKEAGVSYGIADTRERPSAREIITLADSRMYEYKTSRRRARASDRAGAALDA